MTAADFFCEWFFPIWGMTMGTIGTIFIVYLFYKDYKKEKE